MTLITFARTLSSKHPPPHTHTQSHRTTQRAVYTAVWSAAGHCAMATNGRFDALMKDALGLFLESLRRQTILALILGS